MKKIGSLIPVLILFFTACASPSETEGTDTSIVQEVVRPKGEFKKAYFAAGCFWCVEAVFESLRGVEEVISGYSGGEKESPSYYEVGHGLTNHAEAVEIFYDPKVIDFKTLLVVFFHSQDPTTPNRQGPDRGSQYRSVIFYQNETEKNITQSYIKELDASHEFNKPIVTELTQFDKFWDAEDYHQNYVKINPNNPYVQHESIPRAKRFQEKYQNLIKDGALF